METEFCSHQVEIVRTVLTLFAKTGAISVSHITHIRPIVLLAALSLSEWAGLVVL